MICSVSKEKCCGCEACVQACPTQCISMQEDLEGFRYPLVGKGCIQCNRCRDVCPVGKNNQNVFEPQTWFCQNKNDKVRYNSSSGGAFSIFAEYFISEKKGIVYGALFDESMEVVHGSIDSVEKISLMRGSKYVQSKVNNSFKEIEELLKNDAVVCFSGTPCQISGLKNYLQKEYDSLFTIGVVCHGVPSPKLWRKYITEKENKYRKKIINVAFRDKRLGYRVASMRLDFSDNTSKHITPPDLFFNAYFANICSRPSCYNCSFKSRYYNSDLTLFDCWHTKEIAPELDDNMGSSYIMINSSKGQKVFEELREKMNFQTIDTDWAIRMDGSMVEKSVNMHPNRELFFANLDSYSIKELTKRFIPTTKRVRVNNALKMILDKVGVLPVVMKYLYK